MYEHLCDDMCVFVCVMYVYVYVYVCVCVWMCVWGCVHVCAVGGQSIRWMEACGNDRTLNSWILFSRLIVEQRRAWAAQPAAAFISRARLESWGLFTSISSYKGMPIHS